MELNSSVKEDSIRATDHPPFDVNHKSTCVGEPQFYCSSESPMSVMSTSSVTLSNFFSDYLSHDGSQNCDSTISSFIENSGAHNDFHYSSSKDVDNDMNESFSPKTFIGGSSSVYKNVGRKFIFQNHEYLPCYNIALDSFSNQRMVAPQDVPDSSSLDLSSNFVWFFPLAHADNFCLKKPVSHVVDTGITSELLDIPKNDAHNANEGSFIEKEEASYINMPFSDYADYQLTKHISAKQYCVSKLYMLRLIFPAWAAHADSYRWHWRKVMGCKDSMLASYIVILSQVTANHFQNFYAFYFSPENSVKRIEVIQVLHDLDELRVMEDATFISLSSYPLINVNMNEVSIPTNGIIALKSKTNIPKWNFISGESLINMNKSCGSELRGCKDSLFLEHNKGFHKDSVVCCEQPFIYNYDMHNSFKQKSEQCREELELERKMQFDSIISSDIYENELSSLLSLKSRSVSISSVGSLDDPTRPTGNKCESHNIKVNKNKPAENSQECVVKHEVDKIIEQEQNTQQNYSSVYDLKENNFSSPSTEIMHKLYKKSICSSSRNLSAHTSSVLTSKNKLSTRGKRSHYSHSLSSFSDDNQATTRRIKPGIIYTSKVAGVSWRSTPVPLWRCRWRDPATGRDLSKCFSIKKYGFEHAKQMAEEWVIRIRQDILLLVNRKESNGECSKIFKNVKLQKKKHNIFLNDLTSQEKCDNAELRDILRAVRYHKRSRAWVGFYKVGDVIKEKYFFVSKHGYNQAMKAANRFTLQNFCLKKEIAEVNECEMNESTSRVYSTTMNEEDKKELQNYKLDYFKASQKNYSKDRFIKNFQELNQKCDEMETFAAHTTTDVLSFEQDVLNSLSPDMEDVNDNSDRLISCGFTNSASMDGDLLKNSERYVSDVQGVIFDHGCHSWRAYWTDPDTGRQLARRFSVRKYGINKSRIMAELVRKAVERFGGRLPNIKTKNDLYFLDSHGEKNQELNNDNNYTAAVGYAKTVEQENLSSDTTLLTKMKITNFGNNYISSSDNFLLSSKENGSSAIPVVSTCSETTASLNCIEEDIVKQEDKKSSNNKNWLTLQNSNGVKISECENGFISTASNSEESEMHIIKKTCKMQSDYGKKHNVEEETIKKVKTRVNNYVDFEDCKEKNNELYAGQILHLQRIKKDGKIFVAEVIFVGPRRVRVRWIEGCTDVSLIGAEQHINLCDFWQRYQRVKNSKRLI